jgi:hypothetical protein
MKKGIYLSYTSRLCYARRVIMIQNHRSSISFKRTLYHNSRVNLRAVNRSLEHLLETQHAMPVIEKHCAEVFGFTVVEFELQILSHGSRGGEFGPNLIPCSKGPLSPGV